MISILREPVIFSLQEFNDTFTVCGIHLQCSSVKNARDSIQSTIVQLHDIKEKMDKEKDNVRSAISRFFRNTLLQVHVGGHSTADCQDLTRSINEIPEQMKDAHKWTDDFSFVPVLDLSAALLQDACCLIAPIRAVQECRWNQDCGTHYK